MEYNGDFKYDLVVGQLGETLIGNLLSNETIEVKFDFGTYRTGTAIASKVSWLKALNGTYSIGTTVFLLINTIRFSVVTFIIPN